MNRLTRYSLLVLLSGLVAGCALVGGGKSGGIAVHSPLPTHGTAAPEGPVLPWQLVIARPSAERMIDSARIAVRTHPNELQVYRGAVWSMPATDLVETSVLRALEDSGQLAGVARSSSGLRADYRLVMDVRRFEADYAGRSTPVATIEISAKLLHSQTQRVVASQVFLHHEPAGSTALTDVVPAFQTALSRSSLAIAGWLLANGQHDHQVLSSPGTR